MYKNILIVFGTRPEAIKLAPLYEELSKRVDLSVTLLNTGQHKEILDQVIEIFDLKVAESLGVLKAGQSLSDQISLLLQKISSFYAKFKPDLVIVQGDTSTAFAAGLAAFYQGIPVAHIEAGLRTHDREQPFPEEFNRYILSYLTDFHFVPTIFDAENLKKEGYPSEHIFVVGNTVVDSVLHILNSQNAGKLVSKEVKQIVSKLEDKKLVLVTSHRRENFGEPIKNICDAVCKLSENNEHALFLYSVHPNPNVQDAVKNKLKNRPNVILHAPFSYVDFLFLLKSAHFVMSDSGGIQEEASVLGKPVLVLREKTERVFGIKKGVARIVGTSTENIIFHAEQLLHDHAIYEEMANLEAKTIYGDGDASKKIVELLTQK